MTGRSLDEWLQWQESLNPREIDLGLERVSAVAQALELSPPDDAVFVVGGTNGKGSTVHLIEQLMLAGGRQPGAYTSPHLVKYNERVRIGGRPVDDWELVQAFETIESVRAGQDLTYFEYGTLAALQIFSSRDCDAWVLEVGLGGRLDAVNAVDADYCLLTTIALDHQEWLGNSIEEIAAEKAGIMRPGRPVLFGDRPVPLALRSRADELGARLLCLGDAFDYVIRDRSWDWMGDTLELTALPLPPGEGEDQVRNRSLALAALEQHAPELISDADVVRAVFSQPGPAGRFQVVDRGPRQWVLDVAHNPQAAGLLAAKLATLEPVNESIGLLGMLEGKQPEAFAAALAPQVDRWITCSVDAERGLEAADLARTLESADLGPVINAGDPEAALRLADSGDPGAGRVLVCGSFHVVGPALAWLGLY